MKKRYTYKIFSIVLSILLLAGLLMLFIIFQNQIVNIETLVINPTTIYILFLAMILLLILLLILTIFTLKISTPIPGEKGKDNHITIQAREEEKLEELIDNTKVEENPEKGITQDIEMDISPFVKRIIPRYSTTKDPDKFNERLLINLAKEFEIVEGLLYIKTKGSVYTISGLYAYFSDEKPKDFKEGEGLNGQVIKNRTLLNVKNVPEGYVKVLSGLGQGSPKHMLIVPIIFEEDAVGLLELASFKEFDAETENIISKLSTHIGEGITSILKGDKK